MLFISLMLSAIVLPVLYMLLDDYYHWHNGRPLTDPKAQAEKLAYSNPHLLDLLQEHNLLPVS